MNSNGQVLRENNEQTINVNDLPAGMYLLEAINDAGNHSIRKFIKR
ncbi:MAG: T9SS type A sorting domain-containing protein [Aureispira sp.]